MTILALDPAKLCGFCHSDGTRGVWDLGEEKYRLSRFLDLIVDFRAGHPFDVLAVEDAPKVRRNWQATAQHAELRAIIKLASSQSGAELVFINPMSLKAWAAHSGRATKGDMKRWAKIHYGVEIDDDNECDAFLIMKYVEAGQHLRAVSGKVVRKREKFRRKKEARLF